MSGKKSGQKTAEIDRDSENFQKKQIKNWLLLSQFHSDLYKNCPRISHEPLSNIDVHVRPATGTWERLIGSELLPNFFDNVKLSFKTT